MDRVNFPGKEMNLTLNASIQSKCFEVHLKETKKQMLFHCILEWYALISILRRLGSKVSTFVINLSKNF